MSDRREWKWEDMDEVRRMFADETGPVGYYVDDEGEAVARHFGHEVRYGIPHEGGYWALEPRCVIALWSRKPGEKWSCLRCYGGSYAFDSQIRDEWMREFKANTSLSTYNVDRRDR
jgi:hypothetical protein